ncbi:hypothetical protein Tco_0553349 [Tanacetum coccineum]
MTWFGAEELVEVVEVPVLVLESTKRPPRLLDQAHQPHGHQPQQLTASLTWDVSSSSVHAAEVEEINTGHLLRCLPPTRNTISNHPVAQSPHRVSNKNIRRGGAQEVSVRRDLDLIIPKIPLVRDQSITAILVGSEPSICHLLLLPDNVLQKAATKSEEFETMYGKNANHSSHTDKRWKDEMMVILQSIMNCLVDTHCGSSADGIFELQNRAKILLDQN